MQNPNKPIWFNEDTYQTIQQSTTKAEVIDLSDPQPESKSPWRIMVCTPVHSECSIHYTQALLKFQQECFLRKILVSFTLMKSSLVTQGRNLCVSNFMNSKADRMLFIDSDIEFSTRSVFRLLKSPHDVALIPYPMKTVNQQKFEKDLKKRPQDLPNKMGKV